MSYYDIELLTLNEIKVKDTIQRRKIFVPDKLSGTDKNPAFTRDLGSRISQIALKSTRDPACVLKRSTTNITLQESKTEGSVLEI